ncbi:MAG TPA: cell wall hydrolase, partial [Aestuariivirga sp.]
MNRTILALVFTVALTVTAQDSGWKDFDAPAELVAEVQNTPIMPDKLRRIHGTPLNHATSPNGSWTQKIKTILDTRVIQENCLTTAVYFEARSESMVGQLAVAMVILNRVKASNYPISICGVVYKGASHPNACQFSFACDGKPDIMDDARAWNAAYAVTALALSNDRN